MSMVTCFMKSTSSCCQTKSEAVLLRRVAGVGQENPWFADPHRDRESCCSHSALASDPAVVLAGGFDGGWVTAGVQG